MLAVLLGRYGLTSTYNIEEDVLALERLAVVGSKK